MNFAHVMDFTTVFALVITLIAAITVFKGIRIVPQQSVWIVEKLGKYDRKLEPGLNIIIPYILNRYPTSIRSRNTRWRCRR